MCSFQGPEASSCHRYQCLTPPPRAGVGLEPRSVALPVLHPWERIPEACAHLPGPAKASVQTDSSWWPLSVSVCLSVPLSLSLPLVPSPTPPLSTSPSLSPFQLPLPLLYPKLCTACLASIRDGWLPHSASVQGDLSTTETTKASSLIDLVCVLPFPGL